MIRASLGTEAEPCRGYIEDWACEDPEWCSTEYFAEIWDSLNGGQRVGQRALNEFLNRKGIFASARFDFPDDAHKISKSIQADRAARKENEDALLEDFARDYVIGRSDLTIKENLQTIRRRDDPERAFAGFNWWQSRSDDLNQPLVQKLRTCGRYTPDEAGFWDFTRELKKKHPSALISGTTRNPNYDRGETVTEKNQDGTFTHKINLRYLSPAIRFAQRAPHDLEQASADLKILLQFQKLIFGREADYELDTLAYMAQTGKRPGCFLYLVGDPGVGKSLYTNLVRFLFDGQNRNMGNIDGAKLVNENACRFIFSNIEGCRTVNIQELPADIPRAAQARIISTLKQRVDIGGDGDYVHDERKFLNNAPVQNFARYSITTNYENALAIEPNDRRAFVVRCNVSLSSRPKQEFYEELGSIIEKPERLATLWRYLLTRNCREYDPAKAPPLSNAKLEGQICAIEIPAKRYGAAAFELIRASGRKIFDVLEFSDLAEDMAENEARNLGHRPEHERFNYQKPGGPEQAALQYILVRTEKTKPLKTRDGKRLPTMYVLNDTDLARDVMLMSRDEVLDALDRDRAQHPFVHPHPLRTFAYASVEDDDLGGW